ncbi:MAG: OmpH family outer membrane protein [Bacteroidia bacterium]|nr:OmpH family outer membrane protein [Bacteroidia bacterium]
MNTKAIWGISVINFLLILWLLFKSFSGTEKNMQDNTKEISEKNQQNIQTKVNASHEPTGKIAFINIDTVNEKSLFVADMVKKLKASKNSIEASLESLQQQYQQKIKEYQNSASAGIAPESELAAKAKEIQAIEREAQNKQIQMDNLAMELNEKNEMFQREVKSIIQREFASKYDYIFTYSDAVPTMLYGNSAFDITNQVVELINAEYKKKKEEKSKSK